MRSIHELEIKKLLKLAIEAMDRSYSPYSEVKVGTCLKGDSGAYYLSANVENASYATTVCAESSALCKAVYEGERGFDAIAVVSEKMITPCGICRQALSEFCDDEMPVICGNKHGEYKVYAFGDLFPVPFSMTNSDDE